MKFFAASLGLPLAAVALLGCSSAAPTASSAASVDVLAQLASSWTAKLSATQIQAWNEVSVTRYYATLLTHTTDDAVLVNGHVIASAHSALLNAAPLFASLQMQYGSMGAIFSASADLPTASKEGLGSEFAQLGADAAAKRGWFAGAEASSVQSSPLALGVGSSETQIQAVRNISALETLAGSVNPNTNGSLGLVQVGGLVSGGIATTAPRSLVSTRCQNPKGATVYFWPKSNLGLGHIAAGVQYGNRSTFSSYPNAIGSVTLQDEINSPWQGGRQPLELDMPPMTDEQADAFFDQLDNPAGKQMSDVVNGTGYNLFANNCAHKVNLLLKAAGANIGINGKPYALKPGDVWNQASSYVDMYNAASSAD